MDGQPRQTLVSHVRVTESQESQFTTIPPLSCHSSLFCTLSLFLFQAPSLLPCKCIVPFYTCLWNKYSNNMHWPNDIQQPSHHSPKRPKRAYPLIRSTCMSQMATNLCRLSVFLIQ